MSDSEERSQSDVPVSDSEINEEQDGEDDPYKCATAEEIPVLLEQLKATSTDEFDKAADILGNTIQLQEELATEHIVPQTPYIFDLTKNAPSPARRASLIELIWKLLAVGEQSRAAAKPFVKDLIDLLLVEGPSGNRFYLAQSIEMIVSDTSEDDAVRTQVLDAFRRSIFTVRGDDSSTPFDPPHRLTYVTEFLRSILMFGHDTIRALAFQAGALDFALYTCHDLSPECRKTAVSCIQQVYIRRGAIAEEASGSISQPSDPAALGELALNALIKRLPDTDLSIATSTLDFLESADLPDGFLASHPTFPELLVCHISRWSTETHFPTIYDALVAQNEDDNVVIDGFREVWGEGNTSMALDVKVGIVRRLDCVYPSVRQAAVKGGLVEFVLRMLGPDEVPETAVSILNAVKAILEQDQGFGGHLFKGGILLKLVYLLADINAPAPSRAVAASTLSALIESYTPDLSDPLRKDIVKVLTVPETFAQITSILQDLSQTQVVNETFDLLCNIFKDNGDVEESEDENNDDDQGPAEPNANAEPQGKPEKRKIAWILKDRLVDEALISHTVSGLSVPEVSSGASDLLAQIVYYYPRGLALVTEALRPVVPTASAGFFAALLPEGGRHTITWDPFYEIEKAVVDAGGFERSNEIMKGLVEELEKGGGTAAERKTAVKGVRALLSGEDVDNNLAQKNAYLPKLVESLLSDGDLESLTHVKDLMGQLAEHGRENPLEEWKDVVATDGVGRALLKALAVQKPEERGYEDLNEEVMGREAYKGALEKRQVEEVAAQRRYDDTMASAAGLTKYIAPILPSFRTRIATALFSAYFKDDDHCLEVALESFVTFENPDAANPEYAPLVEAVQAVLASPEPPSSYKILGATRSSIVLGVALYLGGIFPWLVERLPSTPDNTDDEPKAVETLEVVDIFSSIISNLKDADARCTGYDHPSTYDTHILAVRTAFFGAPDLLKALQSSIIQEGVVGDDWDRYPVINGGETLFKLASGYAACLPAIVSLKPSIVPSLVRVYDDEYHDAEASTAPLLGILVGGSKNIAAEGDVHDGDAYGLSSSDIEAIQEIVRKQVEQLDEPKDTGKPGKGKKGKKKKRYTPRLSLKQVLERSAGFLSGAAGASGEVPAVGHDAKKLGGKSGVSVALDIVVNAGAVDLAFKILESLEVLENDTEVGVLALRHVQSVLKLSKNPLLGSHASTIVLKPRLQDLSKRLTSFSREKRDDDDVELTTKELIYSIVANISFNTLLDGINPESGVAVPSESFGEPVGSTVWINALKNLGTALWLSNDSSTQLYERLRVLVNYLRDLENGTLEDGLRADIRDFLGGVTR